MKRARAAALALAAASAACGTSQLAHQAARDLRCPAKQIEVTEVDEVRQRADGCGRTASYVCSVDMHSRTTCVRERTSARKTAQDEAASLFRCPPERVTLDDGPDADSYVARGCGREATFTCHAVGDSFRCARVGGAAVIDEPAGSAPAAAPPR